MSRTTDALAKDHDQHHRLLERLAQAVDAQASPAEVHARWHRFETNLFDHMDTEERVLFGVFSQSHRLELQSLRAAHQTIRTAAIALHVSVALHRVQRPAIEELQALLRAHAEQEDASLHLWIDRDEGILSHRGVLAMIARRSRVAEEPTEIIPHAD